MYSWRPGYDESAAKFDAAAVHRTLNCHRNVKPISKDENDPDGTRTRVAGVKGRSPRPLDEGAVVEGYRGNVQVYSAMRQVQTK